MNDVEYVFVVAPIQPMMIVLCRSPFCPVAAVCMPDSNLILTIIGSPVDPESIILKVLQQQHYSILDQPGAVISPGNDCGAAKRFRCPVVRDKIEFLVAVV